MTSSSSTILPLLIAFGSLLIGTLFLFIGWYLWYEGRDLRNNGHTVTATVLGKFRKEDQGLLGQLENYYVRCAFQDMAGRLHEVEMSVQSKLWLQMREGNTTQLTYVPTDPDETQPGSLLDWRVRGVIGIVMMTFGALAVIFISVGAFQECL